MGHLLQARPMLDARDTVPALCEPHLCAFLLEERTDGLISVISGEEELCSACTLHRAGAGPSFMKLETGFHL